MILTKYLTKEVLKSQIVVFFILILIFFSQQLIKVLGQASSGKITSDIIAYLLALSLPIMSQLVLPLCLFIGILISYGALYSQSQITAMNACGLSYKKLISPVIKISIFTALIASFNVFYLSPKALNLQLEVIANTKANPSLSMISAGRFIKTQDNLVLFIDKIKDDKIENLYLFQGRNNNSPNAFNASSGKLSKINDETRRFSLNDASSLEILNDKYLINSEIRNSSFNKYLLDLNIIQTTVKDDKTERMSLKQLLNSLNNNPSNEEKFNLNNELAWRISLVLSVILMAFIAIPLSYVNPRSSRMSKLLPALLIYLIYFLLTLSLKSSAQKMNLNPVNGVLIINFIYLLLGLKLNFPNFFSLKNLRKNGAKA